MFCSCFVVLCIFIFVCTCVGLLPPGENPIAVSNNNSSSSSTGFYNPLTGFSHLILEVSRSHTRTHHSR
jgi:hypothetical protein